jgi:tetratricopeptide (TPR) repeat protein/predicted Ser/Thr protein kinase
VSGTKTAPEPGAETRIALLSTQAVDAPAPTAAQFRAGQTFGRYQIQGLLGTGGMGHVFEAFDPDLGRTVALKLIRADSRGPSSSARTRLLREAQALAKLQHANVVTVYDVGTARDQVFIAMELVKGPTLGAWLASGGRPWRAIRDTFLAAGRGLAAAHAADIVHRDFKPSNVIVGPDRVVVVDFGLARARSDDSSGEARGAGVLDLDVTLTGERVGTPRYMAPEQHAGAPVSALADQFAFATALWTALYGAAPFRGQTSAELLEAIGKGPAAPPPESKVPERVRAALARALALRPEDRWPTLAALLGELAHDPAAARRVGLSIGFVAAALIAVGGSTYAVGLHTAAQDPCAGGDAIVAPLWDESERAATRAAFQHAGRPYSDAVFGRLDASLRRRLDDWTRGHRDACEASHVRHEQSAALLDARMACLGRARLEIAELVSLLRQPDADALDRAVDAAGSLGDVTACADVIALRDAVPPPREPAIARAVEGLRGEVARLTALGLLGRVREGAALGRAVIERAREVGYAPVLAAALEQGSRFEQRVGHADLAVELGYEAARVAAAARDDGLVAQALGGVALALGHDRQRFEAAEVAYRSAVTAAARAANPGPILARLYGDRANVLAVQGDYRAALPLSQVAFAISVHLHGLDHVQAAHGLMDVADAVSRLGDPAKADAMYAQALAIAEAAMGAEHPIAVAIVNNAGANRMAAFDVEGAAPLYERALRAKEHVYGADSANAASSAKNLGIVRREQRRLPEARALLERAVRVLRATLGPEHPLLAESHAELAAVARLEGRADEALAGLDRAIAIQRAAFGAAHPDLAGSHRARAELLLALGRRAEAAAAVSAADEIDRKLGADPAQRGETLRLRADVLAASGRSREAVTLHEQALALLEAARGKDSPGLIRALLGLAAAELDAGDAARALSSAERAAAIGSGHAVAVDVQCAAEFLVARARWAEGRDRAGAQALARNVRARLAALPYPSETLAGVERWLARVPD